jgi:hypothetical protein
MRILIRNLPREFLPQGFDEQEHMAQMRIVNPQSGSTITGDIGDNIGRGGRSLIYFKDESAHYVHAEMIEAALSGNARVQIDISSVHGLGTVFDRKIEAGVYWTPGKCQYRGARISSFFVSTSLMLQPPNFWNACQGRSSGSGRRFAAVHHMERLRGRRAAAQTA